jgi:uncharacterized delta-60 repeat protein
VSRGRPARRAIAALAAALAGVLAAAAPGALAAAPGDPDPHFDVDGRRAFGYGGDDRATDVALLPDGRIVMAGWTTVNGDLFVTRLTRRGAFDTRFGRGGTTDLDLGGDDRANALALQPDGKVVVAGRTSRRAGDMAVLRLRQDGSLDRGFGRGGVATFGTARGDAAYDVAVQRDGRIVVAGSGGRGRTSRSSAWGATARSTAGSACAAGRRSTWAGSRSGAPWRSSATAGSWSPARRPRATTSPSRA